MGDESSNRPGLRRPWSLVGTMLLQYAACGSVLPFITMFLRDRGLPYERIGLILLASSTVMLVAPFFWGMLADRLIPLNRVFTGLNLLGALALWAVAKTTGFGGLLVAYTAFTACLYPIFTLTNALAFHHLPRPREQFPRLRAWGSLGWILPFLPISLWTAWRPAAGLGFTLWLGAGLCVAMAAFAFCLPHTEPGARRGRAGAVAPRLYGPALKRLLRDGNYLALLISMFLMSGAFTMVLFYSPPFLEKLGVGRPWIGPIQAGGVVVEIALFRWQPFLLRRFRITSLILVGIGALVARHLLYAVSANLWLLSGSYALVAVVVVFHHIGVSILANALAAAEVRATAQSLLAFCGMGLGPMFANALASALTGHFHDDLRPVFLAGALMAGLAGGVIAWRRRGLEKGSRAAL